MTFIDNVIELILISVLSGILTTVIFGVVFIYGGIMFHDEKSNSDLPVTFTFTIVILFFLSNIILFIVSVNQIFFN